MPLKSSLARALVRPSVLSRTRLQARTRCVHTSTALCLHPFFSTTTAAEARSHLGFFVGKNSEWQRNGIPWRVYRPGVWFKLGSEVGGMEALQRLKEGQPVCLQRMRVVTLTPDFNALEGLATSLAAPALRGLVKASKETPLSAASPHGMEVRTGQPTTIRSFAELKLFSAIYNEDVTLPDRLSTQQEVDEGRSQEEAHSDVQLSVARLLSSLNTRRLESGLQVFSEETRTSRRFLWHFHRQSLFFIPLALLVVCPALSSTYLSDLLQLQAMPLWPGWPDTTEHALESLNAGAQLLRDGVESAVHPSTPARLADTIWQSGKFVSDWVAQGKFLEYSVGVGTVAGTSAGLLRSLWLSVFDVTPLGYAVTSYEAFNRVVRGDPIILQEMTLHTLRVPFVTTISWFTLHRPGDRISSPKDLEDFCDMYHSHGDSAPP